VYKKQWIVLSGERPNPDNSLAITNGYETEAIRWLRWVPRDEMKALELLVTCGC